MSSRHRIAAVLGCLSLSFAGAAPAAAADAYPSKPIRLIVPYPAGGGFDTVARRLADGLRERLATPVIVENKPGGNTIIAPIRSCARSPTATRC